MAMRKPLSIVRSESELRAVIGDVVKMAQNKSSLCWKRLASILSRILRFSVWRPANQTGGS